MSLDKIGTLVKLATIVGGTEMRGTHYRWSKAPLVESYLPLDTSQLREAARRILDKEKPAAAGSLTWTNGTAIGFALVPAKAPGALWLRLQYSANGKPVDYRVPIVSKPVHFGGRRLYFICPLIVNGVPCHRRVGKLYMPKRGRPEAALFGCRHCHGLTYASTRASELDRLRAEMEKITRRLGGKPEGIFLRLPDKPPGMHWDTYSRLACRFDALQAAELRELDRTMNMFRGRMLDFGLDLPELAEPERLTREERIERRLAEWREIREAREADAAALREWREEERERRRYPTLGKIAERAAVPYAFALEAQRAGLVRADKGRGTRRRRYRAKLAAWLEKLYVLNQSGYSFEELAEWSARRWQPGNEDERRFPRGFAERGGR